MANTSKYSQHFITVKVDLRRKQLVCDPEVQDIKPNTISTITWKPGGRTKFLFLTFQWCENNGFLAQDPIVHDQCVVAVVNNTASIAKKDWPYRLKVQVGNCVYEADSKLLSADGADGIPKIHTQ